MRYSQEKIDAFKRLQGDVFYISFVNRDDQNRIFNWFFDNNIDFNFVFERSSIRIWAPLGTMDRFDDARVSFAKPITAIRNNMLETLIKLASKPGDRRYTEHFKCDYKCLGRLIDMGIRFNIYPPEDLDAHKRAVYDEDIIYNALNHNFYVLYLKPQDIVMARLVE